MDASQAAFNETEDIRVRAAMQRQGLTPQIARNIENCIHCNKQFPMTPYKLKKHYRVCDDCVRSMRQIRAAMPSNTIASNTIAKVATVLTPITSLNPAVKAEEKVAPVLAEIAKSQKKERIDVTQSYVPQNGEIEDLELNIKCNHNVLLTGPTQCGKTTLVEFVAKRLERKLITVQGGNGASFERIVAKDALVEENGVTVTVRPSADKPETWSVLPKAMSEGAILYVDEPNSIPSEVLMYLFSAMDYRRTITFDNGTSLKAKEGFIVLCAMNEGVGYSGTSLLNNAFRARSKYIIDMDYLPSQREAKMVAQRTGIDDAMAVKLCNAAASLRASLKAGASGGITTPIGTSAVLACATLIKEGMPVGKAIRGTFINQVPSTKVKERGAVSDVLAAHFGKEIR